MTDLGVFLSLENLERAHVKSKQTTLQSSKHSAHLKALQARKVKLEEKKKALENQLDQRRKGIQQVKTTGGSLGEIDDEVKDVLLSLEEKKLVDILQAYRLTGSTLESLSKDVIRLRLETCYCGKYSQPFYTELQINNNTFALKRHTLPKFIPEEEMREKLDCGLNEFCSFVHSYLMSYMARREEAFQTQDKFQAVIDGEICSSPSFDFLQINFKKNFAGIQCIKLLYEDILSVKPTLVQVTLEDEEGSNLEDSEQVETLKIDLECLPLSEVFTTHFTDVD